MASSTYRTDFVATKLNTSRHIISEPVIRYISPVQEVEKEDDSRLTVLHSTGDFLTTHELINKELKSRTSYPDVVRIKGEATHSCRETLLSEIFQNQKSIDFFEQYNVYFMKQSSFRLSNSMVFIKYLTQDYTELTESHIRLMLEFSKKFLTKESNGNFHVQESEGNIVLSYKTESSMRSFTASMILWIFRNKDIMVNCLKKFENQSIVPIKNLWFYLSQKFLENDAWGNDANPNVALSLFCYGVSIYEFSDHYKEEWTSGPATFAYRRFPPSIMWDWMTDVLLKAFPSGLDESIRLGDCPSDFSGFVFKLHNQMVWVSNTKRVQKELREETKSKLVVELGRSA